MNIKEINGNSLTKTIFYIKDMSQDDLIEELDYFNIVFAQNGVFEVFKNSLYIYFKQTDLNYQNSKLNELQNFNLIQLVQKPDVLILQKIVDLFLYVKNKINYELIINLYFDKKKKEFIIDLFKQTIDITSVNYQYNNKYENNERYIRYLQIHSHNDMPAQFSSTDNNDEIKTCPSYFGVIGELLNKNYYNQKYRICCHDNFIEVDSEIIFDYSDQINKLEPHEKKYLDSLIKETKVKK